MGTKDKRDVYQEVTNKVLELMETHGTDWVKPWTETAAGIPRNVITGAPYHGTNVFLLSLTATAKGYTSPEWATFKQWRDKGACVRKGERSTMAILFKPLVVTEENSRGEETQKSVPLLRHFSVFNADQVDGYQGEPDEHKPAGFDAHVAAESWVCAAGARVQDAGHAFYAPGADLIGMPPASAFTEQDRYYSTLLHELTHWTGAQHRLDRLRHGGFGSHEYAREELVAELGAAFQCVLLGVTHGPREDHAKYLNNWIRKLRTDKRAFVKAASRAQQAVDYIAELQTEAEKAAAA